jgi:hypothetical protein
LCQGPAISSLQGRNIWNTDVKVPFPHATFTGNESGACRNRHLTYRKTNLPGEIAGILKKVSKYQLTSNPWEGPNMYNKGRIARVKRTMSQSYGEGTKVGVLRASHKIFLSLRVKFE